MGLDKSWMQIIDRTQPLYEKGVIDFIEFAFTDLEEGKLIRCPCKKCNNNLFQLIQLFDFGQHRNRPGVVGQPKNRAQMNRTCTRNIPTLFGVQFLSFLVNTTEKCFCQILIAFSGLETTGTGPEQTKLKIGSG